MRFSEAMPEVIRVRVAQDDSVTLSSLLASAAFRFVRNAVTKAAKRVAA